MCLLDPSYRKALKDKLATYIHDLIKYFINDKYDDDLIAFTIRACHLHAPIYCMIGLITLPFFFAGWIYVFLIIVAALFVYLRGCFLSLTEYKFGKKDITIADPVIMLFNGDITPQNRIWYSLAVIIPYIIIATGIMAYRFYM